MSIHHGVAPDSDTVILVTLSGFGYAPGLYHHPHCQKCDKEFVGDKLAVACRDYAEKSLTAPAKAFQAEPTREQMHADLARAMGWTDIGWMSGCQQGFPPKGGGRREPIPDPFTSADDSHALKLWLAEDRPLRLRFMKYLREFWVTHCKEKGFFETQECWEWYLMTADLPIIAEAAWCVVVKETRK
jgi:hypothetical protein